LCASRTWLSTLAIVIVAPQKQRAEIKRRLATGEEELIPAEIVDRLIDGENKLRVWREYRGMSAKELAEATGLAAPYISQLETGKPASA
jgi:uncharacterized phage-associated protein